MHYKLFAHLVTFRDSNRTEMKTENDKYVQLYYIQTYARIPPYLIGILLGWLIHKTRAKKIQMKKVRNSRMFESDLRNY